MNNVYILPTQNTSSKTRKSEKNAVKSQVMENTGKKIRDPRYEGGRFCRALKVYRGLDVYERLMIAWMIEFLNYEHESYIGKPFFHSNDQWAEELEIGLATVKRKIKSLAKKKIWTIESPSKVEQMKGKANVFKLTPKIFDAYLVFKIQEKTKKGELTVSQPNSNIDAENYSDEIGGELTVSSRSAHKEPPTPSVLTPSILTPSMCVNARARESEEQPTHTSLKIQESKTKQPNDIQLKKKLAGKLSDYVRMRTGQKWVDFSEMVLFIEDILKHTKLSIIELDKHFYDFKQYPRIHELMDLNNFNIVAFKSALIKFCTINEHKPIEIPQQEGPKETAEQLIAITRELGQKYNFK